MHIHLIDDSITTNIYSLKDIYRRNILTLFKHILSKPYKKATPFSRFLIRELYTEQRSHLKAINLRIQDVEDAAFRYGL